MCIALGEKYFTKRKISPPPLIGKNFIFVPYVKDGIEDMATFTALAENFFHQIFNTKVHVAGLEKILIQQRFPHVYSILQIILPVLMLLLLKIFNRINS